MLGLALSLRGSGRREPQLPWSIAILDRCPVGGGSSDEAGRQGRGGRAGAVAPRCWTPLSGGEGQENEGIRKGMCAGIRRKRAAQLLTTKIANCQLGLSPGKVSAKCLCRVCFNG
jgi:hypothetical protein